MQPILHVLTGMPLGTLKILSVSWQHPTIFLLGLRQGLDFRDTQKSGRLTGRLPESRKSTTLGICEESLGNTAGVFDRDAAYNYLYNIPGRSRTRRQNPTTGVYFTHSLHRWCAASNPTTLNSNSTWRNQQPELIGNRHSVSDFHSNYQTRPE